MTLRILVRWDILAPVDHGDFILRHHDMYVTLTQPFAHILRMTICGNRLTDELRRLIKQELVTRAVMFERVLNVITNALSPN